jgi:hypothetical protein
MKLPHKITAVLASITGQCSKKPAHHHDPAPSNCLSAPEASSIASRYLSLYDTNSEPTLAQVNSTVSANFVSYDGTGTGPRSYGPATVGRLAFYESLTTNTAPASYANSTQTVLWSFHDCSTIAYRWEFAAVSTGYNA